MLSPKMGETIAATADELKDLLRCVDADIGAERWVLAVTANHGLAPDLDATGGWPIHMSVLADWLGRHFGADTRALFLDLRTLGFCLRREALARFGATEDTVVDYIADYGTEKHSPGQSVPPEFDNRSLELVVSTAFPAPALQKVADCFDGSG